MSDADAYRQGADQCRDALKEALGKPLTPEAMRALGSERRYGPYEPSGEAWDGRRVRHDGKEYQGGAVCWPPDICAGSCPTCPKEGQQ